MSATVGAPCQRGSGRLLGAPIHGALYHLPARAPEHVVCTLAAPIAAAVGRYAHRSDDEGAMLASMAANAIAATPLPTAAGDLPGARRHDSFPTRKRLRPTRLSSQPAPTRPPRPRTPIAPPNRWPTPTPSCLGSAA